MFLPVTLMGVIIPRVSNLLGSLWFRVAMNDLENVWTWAASLCNMMICVYHISIHICMYIYIYVHIFIYIYTWHVYIHISKYIHIYIYTYICTGIHKFSPTIPFLFSAFFRKTSGTSSSPRAAPGWHHRAWKPTRLGRSTWPLRSKRWDGDTINGGMSRWWYRNPKIATKNHYFMFVSRETSCFPTTIFSGKHLSCRGHL